MHPVQSGMTFLPFKVLVTKLLSWKLFESDKLKKNQDINNDTS